MSVPDDRDRDQEPEKPRVAFQKKVDTDWKRKIQKEKERLEAGLGAEPPPGASKPPTPPAAAGKPGVTAPSPPSPKGGEDARRAAATSMAFLALVQQLADQAALLMGLYPEQPERHCEQAGAVIEMIRVLQEKTRGNLSPQESKALSGLVYELQMRYVEACGGGGAP